MRFLKDHLFTEDFLIKGHINTGEYRLSNFLNKTHSRFLVVEEAILIRHNGSDPIHASWMQVRIQDILFAYESEETGDDVLRNLSEQSRNEARMTGYFNSTTPVQITGKVHKRVLDAGSTQQHNFFVVTEPEIQGLTVNPAPEYDTIRHMPYVIVNKNRLSFLFK